MLKKELTPQEQIQIDALPQLGTSDYDAAFKDMLQAHWMPFRIAVYAVIIKDNHLLMVHTRSGSKNIINFPGGAVEPGEDFAQAVQRECMEELGMKVKVENCFILPGHFIYMLIFPRGTCTIFIILLQQMMLYVYLQNCKRSGFR